MDKTIRFPNSNAFYSFLESLKKAYDDDRLKDFACIYSCDYEKEEPHPEGFLHKIEPYWFGEKSCIYILGLVDLMKAEIRGFMREKTQQLKDYKDP